MFYSPKLFLSDRWVLVSTALSFLTELATLAYLLIKIHPTGDTLFLHYTVIFGIDLVGAWWELFLPLLVGLFLTVINLTFALAVYKNERFLARFLAVFNAFFNLFLFFGMYLIVGLNA